MKALKEKRISLRSLWRRGLVILSLFALVFASCSDSSSDGGGASRGPRVLSFDIVKSPSNMQYVGQEVDLTGLVVAVKYADGSFDGALTYEGNEAMFTTNPRVVMDWTYYLNNKGGNIYAVDFFLYDLIFDGKIADRPLDFGGRDGIPYPIITENIWNWMTKWDANSANAGMNIDGWKSMGLNVTGTPAKTEAYEDDTLYDFSGLTLAADYLLDAQIVKDMLDDVRDPGNPNKVRNNYVQVPEIKKKGVPFKNVTWQIRPRYAPDVRYRDGQTTDDVYDGYVWITVGQDYRLEREYDARYGYSWASGISTPVALEKVYTVKDVNAINLKGVEDEDLLYNYFFWMENTRKAWIDRMGSGAYLEVTYNDGLAPKIKYIRDLAEKSDIYLNADPDQGALANWTEEGVFLGKMDFDIMTLKYPITKKSGDLGVRIYYRGAQYNMDINVFTVLKAVTANQDIVDFWPDPKWDNDVDNGTGGPLALSKKLTVTAVYQSINKESTQKEIELTYFFDFNKTTKWDPPWKRDSGFYNWPDYTTFWQKGWGTGPFYIFSADADNDEDAEAEYVDSPDYATIEYDDYRKGGSQYTGDNTYAKGYQKYMNNQLKKGPEAVTLNKVTVKHLVNVNTITRDYDTYFYGGFYTAMYGVGILPNAWNFYDSTAKKGPFTTDGRDFGPKVDQKKKAKVQVNWVSHY